MAGAFNELLRDPEPRVLFDLLEKAGLTPAEAAEVFHLTCERAEGVRQTPPSAGFGPTRFAVAWWTNPIEQTWVRVVREEHGVRGVAHCSGLDEDPRPPLWHIAPDRVLVVTSSPGGRLRWRVACACGEVGDPADLLWMGGCCGPCHDRAEEGDASLLSRRPAAFAFGREGREVRAIRDATFSADGAGLFVVEGDGLWEINLGVGLPRLLERGAFSGEIDSIAASLDGRWLAYGLPQVNRVVVRDIHGGGEAVLDLGDRHFSWGSLRPAFSPDGQQLVVGQAYGPGQLFERTGEPGWKVRVSLLPPASCMAFSPRGDVIAMGGDDGSVTLRVSRNLNVVRSFFPDESRRRVGFLDFPADDHRLVILGQDEEDWVSPTLCLADILGERIMCEQELEVHVRSAVLTPDGQYLVRYSAGEADSGAELQFCRVGDLTDVGGIEWNPEERLTAMAFSPDNRLAAIGTERGNVVVFPWRDLLLHR